MTYSPSLYEKINQAATALGTELDKVQNTMDRLVQVGPAGYTNILPRADEVDGLHQTGETFMNLMKEYIQASNNKEIDITLDPAIEFAEKTRLRYQRVISATHEAAHGVVASIVGLDVGATIMNPYGYLDAAVRILLPEPMPPQWPENAVVVARAGFCGAYVVVSDTEAAYGAKADTDAIIAVAIEHGIDAEALKELRAIAYALVFHSFPIIFLVATNLVRVSKMEPGQLRMLFMHGNRALQDFEREGIQEQLALLRQVASRRKAKNPTEAVNQE